MKTNYYTARNLVRHVDALVKLFKLDESDKGAIWDRLRTLEQQGAQMAVAYCNGWITDDQSQKRRDRLLARVDALLGYKRKRIPVILNGDPRGYALKIKSEWVRGRKAFNLHTDFGGYGILAPEFGK